MSEDVRQGIRTVNYWPLCDRGGLSSMSHIVVLALASRWCHCIMAERESPLGNPESKIELQRVNRTASYSRKPSAALFPLHVNRICLNSKRLH
ncbi:hypothetical protein GDO78_018799 [Eleutherodactylus coqui]|uniref:Uncharacterized protein n=1 Tax=Eleutherodactylus coqui TaxID=57060 RepID=A0A8J6B568_ELECQ|nr:hypothetical protein GDO78_018799 [Eleutherodactylus coqui]